MKNKFSVVVAVAIFCLIACDKGEPYFNYIVKGRVIDKLTKEPVRDILLSSYERDLPNSKDGQKRQKMSENPHGYCPSGPNGEFHILNRFATSLIYIYDFENSLYKDTTISVDFSNVPLSGKPSRNYKGEYVLNIGDIELEKME